MLIIALIGLTYLLQIIVAVIVLPVMIDCSSNSYIPAHPVVNMSMQSWITGNMVAGLIITLFMCVSSRSRTENKCIIALIVFLYIAYNIFTFIWSIIGIVMYNDYYGEACKYSDKYAAIMNLGFYTGLVYSSILILGLCLGCCALCTTGGGGEPE